MRFRYVIIGAGRQGVALAYDLAMNGEARSVVLVDSDQTAAENAAQRLRSLCQNWQGAFEIATGDAGKPDSLEDALRGADTLISAAPYKFNEGLTDAALAAKANFCDMGGNTAVVRAQLGRHEQAAAAGVSIVPDCGLAPGLGNHLAAHGIAAFAEPLDVHVRCGGLPERKVGPLGYKILFNFQGLLNEYSGFGEFLRDGRPAEVPALTELEPIQFDELGQCEAAVTSGGTSTCAATFQGRLRTYDYKTVRYPGHFEKIRALFELGCFDETFTDRSGQQHFPSRLMRELFETRLAFPEVRDIVVLRVTVRGRADGSISEVRYDLFDRTDERTGFTAMERTTAFPTAIVAHMQARKLIAPGARPLEISVPPERFFAELPRHDIHVRVARQNPPNL